MKMIVILQFLVFSFLFVGCAQKQVIIKKELVCIEQLLIPRVSADIRIYPADIEVAIAYKESTNSAFGFYENQVKTNNKLCEKIGVENE